MLSARSRYWPVSFWLFLVQTSEFPPQNFQSLTCHGISKARLHAKVEMLTSFDRFTSVPERIMGFGGVFQIRLSKNYRYYKEISNRVRSSVILDCIGFA